jgi:hypothetical protein
MALRTSCPNVGYASYPLQYRDIDTLHVSLFMNRQGKTVKYILFADERHLSDFVANVVNAILL